MSSPTQHFTTIDLDRRKIPLTRLIGVETRKMVDTRAGRWLIFAIVLITLAVVTIMTFVAVYYEENISLRAYLVANTQALGILLPVLGIMTVTGEWGQRTSLTTFTLEPRRGRVIAAKLLAGLIISVIGLSLAWLLSLVAYGTQTQLNGFTADWHLEPAFIVGWGLALVAGFFIGFAFGMLIPNTAAAIVLFFVFQFVVPGALAALAIFWDAFADVLPWIDLTTSVSALSAGDTATAQDWAQLGTGSLVWIGVPLVLGSVLLFRREVK